MCPARRIRRPSPPAARRGDQHVAVCFLREDPPVEGQGFQQLADVPADPVHAGLVVRPALDQDQALEGVAHRLFLVLQIGGQVFQQIVH